MDVALLYRMQHELSLPSNWAGIVMMGLSAGMVLRSVVNPRVMKNLSAAGRLALSAALQVLPPILLSIDKNPLIMTAIQGFVGGFLVVWNVQSVTLRQTIVPDEFRGRAPSGFRRVAWVSIPIGDALVGIVSETAG